MFWPDSHSCFILSIRSSFLNSRNPSQRKNIVPIKGVLPSLLLLRVVQFHQGDQNDLLAPLDRPLLWGLVLQSHPVAKWRIFLKICLYYFLHLKLYNIYSRHSFNATSPLQVHSKAPYPLTLDPKVSLNSRETIFSLETHNKTSKANILSSENKALKHVFHAELRAIVPVKMFKQYFGIKSKKLFLII